jgi:uncharacterized protein YceH (UPF0502 family)
MQLREGEVGSALLDLSDKGLAQRDDQGSRVPKWRQQFQHHHLLPPPAFAVLVTLMLRGAQTLSELRSNAASLGGPVDADGMAAVLKDFTEREPPLAVLLPRLPGQKEQRYAHTLSGPPEISAQPEPVAAKAEAAPARTTLAELEEKIRALEARVEQLERHSRGSGNPEAS